MTVKLFDGLPGMGAHVEADDRQARRCRANTVQLNPREGNANVSGVPSHRGNLIYQDFQNKVDYIYQFLRSQQPEVLLLALECKLTLLLQSQKHLLVLLGSV